MALIVPAALKGALKLYAATEAANIVGDVAVGPFQDRADFIRDGAPTSTAGRIDQQVARATCRRWARGEVGGTPIRDNNLRSVCTPYLNDIGESPDSVITDLPLTGGQCEGVNYSFTIGGFYTSSEGNVSVTRAADCSQPSLDNGPGPISLEQNVPGQFNTIRARIRFGDNRIREVLTTTAGTTQHFLTAEAVRCDGQPDDCGDPPIDYDGPGGRCPGCVAPVDPVVITDDPDYDDIEVDVTFPDDDTICVTINGDTTCFEIPSLVDDGEAAGEAQPGNTGGEPRSGDGLSSGQTQSGSDGGAMPESGGEDVDFGEPPEGKEWVGVLVNVEPNVNRFGAIAGTGPENVVFPRTVGNVSLTYSDVRGSAEPIRSEFTLQFRGHPSQTLTGAKINLLPGSQYSITPLAVTTCPDPICEVEVNDE